MFMFLKERYPGLIGYYHPARSMYPVLYQRRTPDAELDSAGPAALVMLMVTGWGEGHGAWGVGRRA